MDLLERLNLSLPLIQAPMAGTSTPALAAAVSNAGGLGSLAVGALDADAARAQIGALAAQTNRAFAINAFVHEMPAPSPAADAAWLAMLAPLFAEFGAEPPQALRPIYCSLQADRAMQRVLVDAAPAVASFHFGLPPAEVAAELRARGTILIATATSLDEARRLEVAGIDAIVAQGIEAGGHRGVFDPAAPDDALGTMALTRLLVRQCRVPIIAAGGIMDGAGIAAALRLGAVAAQLGTAFVACPESAADAAYRAALLAATHTRMISAISGRPARALLNRFVSLDTQGIDPPPYPTAYDAGKALNAAAKARGEHGFGAQWAGQGAPLARALPAAELVAELARELAEAG